MLSQRLVWYAVVLSFLFGAPACGGSRQQRDEGTASDSDASVVDSGTNPREDGPGQLCASQKSDLQFYAVRAGGGLQEPGAQVLFENGQYFVVRGNCDFFVYGVSGEAATGHLSAAQRDRIAKSFPADTFAKMAGSYTRSGCDTPSDLFVMDGKRILVTAECPAADKESPLATEWSTALTATLKEMFDAGTRFGGPVRFVLVKENRPIPPNYLGYKNAKPWPLSSSAESLAVSEEEADERGTSQKAEGQDSGLLRELRTKFLSGELGFKDGERFIPIQQDDGTRYRLFVRDAIELEDARGLLPFEWQ